jgi:hypothetical protein
MKVNLNTSNIATALVIIIAICGAVLVIVSAVGHPDPAIRLSFKDYIQDMAVAVGLLAVGRGVAKTVPGA